MPIPSAGCYSEQIRRCHGVEVLIRVGLNSGGVVVRSIGSDLHMDYTAVGQTTRLAANGAACESRKHPADGGDAALAEGYVEVKSLGPVAVKGLSEPVDAATMMYREMGLTYWLEHKRRRR